MKNPFKILLLGITLTGLFLVSCNKDDDDSSDNNNNSSTCMITGKLFDRVSDEPVSDAYITFDDRSYTTSSADGTFEVIITQGSRLISIFAEDYNIFSGHLEASGDLEFNMALDYENGAGHSGIVTGAIQTSATGTTIVHGNGFFVQADEDGNYSFRLPTGLTNIQASDDFGVSDATEVSVSNNGVSNVDLTVTDEDVDYRMAILEYSTHLSTSQVQTSAGTVTVRCPDYRSFFIYGGGSNLDTNVEYVVYEFSNGGASQTVEPNQGTINYIGQNDGYYVLESQPAGIVTVTATIYFEDGRTKTEQITKDFGSAESYCGYTTPENELTIETSYGSYNCALNTGNYGIDVADDEFGMWFSTTDSEVSNIYFYFDGQSIPDGDFSGTYDPDDLMLEIEMDIDDTGVYFSEDYLKTGLVTITRSGDTWDINVVLTDDSGSTLTLTYSGALNRDPDWG